MMMESIVYLLVISCLPAQLMTVEIKDSAYQSEGRK